MIDDDLVRLKSEVGQLRRRRVGGREKPHKLAMLLAVLDMADQRPLNGDRRVYFDDELITCFEERFADYAQGNDRCEPGLPFYHLKGPFWEHEVRIGQRHAYDRLPSSRRTSAEIDKIIACARLSEYAHRVISDEGARGKLREFIVGMLERESSKGPAK